MSESRATEIMNTSSINNNKSRTTEMMGSIGTENLAPSHITIGSIIGSGYVVVGIIAENTGEATIFFCTKNNEKYVAKVYHRYKKPNADILSIIKSIDSSYVIKILEDGEVQGRYYEILPFYEKGDLLGNLPDYDFIKKIFIPSINEGLYAIHKKDIVHRDIKPNNIFYGNDGQTIVIGDFGISSQMNAGLSYKLTSTSRTAGYAAPEIYNGIVSKEADYYSLGITLLHLLLQVDPFEGLNDQQIYIITCVKNLEVPNSMDKNMARLIKGLTLKDRNNRWGYNEIKKWLKNEYVDIKDEIKQKDVVPYKFIDDTEYYELEDLMVAFLQNWEEGKKHLYRGYLKRYIEDNFKSFGAGILSKVEDCIEETNLDMGLFKIIYALNPDAPLCWKDRIFGDTISFVDAMLEEFPTVSSYFEEVLKLGIISHYLEVKGNNKDIINTARELESEENIEMAYFKMIYFLDPSKPLHWRGAVYNSLDSLSDAIGNAYNIRVKNKNMKELLLSGALEYFLKINDLTELSVKIEKIRNSCSEETSGRALFDVVYTLNPNALFYFGGRSYKDTLELYEVLTKQTQDKLVGFVKGLVGGRVLYRYLKLNKRDDFADEIDALNKEKNDMYVVFKFMTLLNPDNPYYFEGKSINLHNLVKEILDLKDSDSEFNEKAKHYIKMLNTLGEYYNAKGKTEIGGKLINLKDGNIDAVNGAIEGNLDLTTIELAEILFKMIYIIDPTSPLWWKGKIYKGIDDLIDDAIHELKQNSGSIVYELLSTGLLEYYFIAKELVAEARKLNIVKIKSKRMYEGLSYLVSLYRPTAPMIISGNSVEGILELRELLISSLDRLKDHNHTEMKQIKNDVISLLIHNILFHKTEASINAEDEQSIKHLNWVEEISEMAIKYPDLAFWRLYFGITNKKSMYYRGKEISAVEELVDKIMENSASGIIERAHTLLNDMYFKEWLKTLGFEITA